MLSSSASLPPLPPSPAAGYSLSEDGKPKVHRKHSIASNLSLVAPVARLSISTSQVKASVDPRRRSGASTNDVAPLAASFTGTTGTTMTALTRLPTISSSTTSTASTTPISSPKYTSSDGHARPARRADTSTTQSRMAATNAIAATVAAATSEGVSSLVSGQGRTYRTPVLHFQRQHPHSPTGKSNSKPSLGFGLPVQDISAPPTYIRHLPVRSPCFYHNRFDDAVNIDKMLDEMRLDEAMSHSRLMQTATGVREVSKQLQRRPIRRAVRTVLIVTKARDNDLVALTRELAEWLITCPRYGSGIGIIVYVDAKLQHSRRFDAAGLRSCNPLFDSMLRYWTPALCRAEPEHFDFVLTLGGDGTVLYTSHLFQRVVPPVLSFSLGSLGFLTNFEFDRYKEHLDTVLGDAGMRVNLRMRFTCTVTRATSPTASASSQANSGGVDESGNSDGTASERTVAERYEVLNELVIDRGPSPYVSNLELYGDDHLLTVVQADGCIFSTPTGSTAYSLSAGGSLVQPEIPAILLTPICPHTLSFRPLLLSDSMLLRVAVPRSSRTTAFCAFDGKSRLELRQGDSVTIAASPYPFPTVLSGPTDWFDSIGRNLRWNTRAATQKAWSTTSNRDRHKFRPDADNPAGTNMGSKICLGTLGQDLQGKDNDSINEKYDNNSMNHETFDLDFDDDDDGDAENFVDSTYSGARSAAASPGDNKVIRAGI